MRISKKINFNNNIYNVIVYDDSKVDIEKNGNNINFLIKNDLIENNNLHEFGKLFLEAGRYTMDEYGKFNAMAFLKRLDYLANYNLDADLMIKSLFCNNGGNI